MYILLVNIDTLFRLITNGRIRVSYSLIISIGLAALILLAALTITAMRKQRKINKMKQEATSRENRICKLDNELKSSSSQIGQLRKELSSTNSKLDRRDKRIESLDKKLVEKSDEMSNLSNEIKSLKSILKEAIHNFFGQQYVPEEQLWNEEMFNFFYERKVHADTILKEDWWKLRNNK